MTTREIYFKCLILSDAPKGRIGYTYKDKDDVIQIGENICVELRTNEITVKKSLSKMEEIEKSEGFMFWNISPEAEKFFEENCEAILSGLMCKW